MQLATIFCLEGRHPYHPPDLLLTGLVTDQHRHQFAQIDPISLDPAKTTVDFQTGRVDDDIVNAGFDQGAMQPEAIPARFVATDHPARG